MPTNPTFGGVDIGDVVGIDGVDAYGQREQFLFSGTWVVGDEWQVLLTTTSGNATIGVGNIVAPSGVLGNSITDPMASVCFVYRDRVYLGIGNYFAFSDNGDPTGWEEQNPGAGVIPYLSQYGGQDTVVAFSQLQGRLAVFAQKTIQIWNTDADPNNFAIVQTLDSTGTNAPLSVQALGDYDVLYLDPFRGFRSLRAKEVTSNAYVDDSIGNPIDALIQTIAKSGFDTSGSCGIVDPENGNYWCFVKDTIYVLSRSLGAKLLAWSTFLPTDSHGNTFTPQKFVVFNNQVYVRSVEGGLYSYGGLNAAQYDNTVVTVNTPFLNDNRPDLLKYWDSFQAILEGQWTFKVCTDAKVGDQPGKYHEVWKNAAPLEPNNLVDSTYDTGVIPYQDKSTHFSLLATSSQPARIAKLSAFSLMYNLAEAT